MSLRGPGCICYELLKHIEDHAEEMQDAAGEYKQMEYGMHPFMFLADTV